jgi:hypothetical protein
MHRHLLAGLVVCGFVAAPVCAAEGVEIRVKSPAIGETIRIDKQETRTTRTTITDALGRKIDDKVERVVETLVYCETLLKRSADGKPQRIRRHYEKAQLKTGNTTRNYAFHAMDVVIQRDGERYTFTTADGAAFPGADAAILDCEFNNRDEKFRLEHLLPGKPVKIGAEWSVNMDGAIKDFVRTGRFSVDPAWATGKGHLHTTTPSGGPLFGQILYRMEIPILEMAVSGPMRSAATPGSKATFELTLDMCIDGSNPSATILGTSEVKAGVNLLQAGSATGRLTFVHKCDSKEVRKAAKEPELARTSLLAR